MDQEIEINPEQLHQSCIDQAVQLTTSLLTAHEIYNEILELVFEKIYEKQIDQMVVPFSVEQTISLLGNILELQFNRLDQGETIEWEEPKETTPSNIDTWARCSVPIKRKVRAKIVEDLVSNTPFHQSRQSSNSFLSAFSRTTSMRKTGQQFAQPKITMEEVMPPVPIPLNLPEVEDSTEEDIMRRLKENELRKKKADADRQLRLKKEEEEQDKAAQRQMDELRNKNFTYDHSGNVILIKNPPYHTESSNLVLQFDFPDPIIEETKPRRKVKKQKIEKVKPRKLVPVSETEWVKNMTSPQSSMFESLVLSPGVKLSIGSRQRMEPLAMSDNKGLTRREYLKMVDDLNPIKSNKSARPLGKSVSHKYIASPRFQI